MFRKKKIKPPKLFKWLLVRTSSREEDFTISGDFEEIFQRKYREEGYFKALSWYIGEVMKSIPVHIINSVIWSFAMFKNYMKIAFRNIKRYRSYSFLNIAGLSVGMACFILIMLFVQYELSYDDFHEKADRIYRAQLKINEQYNSVITYGPLAQVLVSEFPEVVDAVRIEHEDEYITALKHENTSFYERGFFVDGNFFRLFTYDLIKGDFQTALADPFSIVITEKLARKYFGDEEAVGKTLTVIEEGSYDVKITGIIKNVPKNSHLQFDFLISLASLKELSDDENYGQEWSGSDFLTYIELKSGTDYRDLESKLPAIIEKHDQRGNVNYYLMPVQDIHLKSQDNFEILRENDIQNVHFLTIIAYLILVIACINYMNLATAKALRRSKEIGVRKIAGAFRRQLVVQFLNESLILSAIAMVIAACITVGILPAFNNIIDREITYGFFAGITLLPVLVSLVLIVGIFSGIYPALYISSFRPVKALSGSYERLTGKKRLRNVFVTFQFCVSIILITGTLIIGRQLDYIKTTDIGYNREQVLAMPIRDDVIRDNLEALKTDLLKNPAIEYVSASSHIPNRITWGGNLVSKDNEQIRTNSCAVDYDYVDLFDIDVVEGRNFSREFTSDRNGAFLLNETAVKNLGWKSPLGREISHWGFKTGKVVGVFKDFHYRSLHRKIGPLYLIFYPERVRILFVKMHSGNIQSVVRFVGETVESYNPEHPFDYFFLDDSFNDMYKSELKFGKIFNWFSALAIFIACLGLLGLISFSAEIRTKEIGIRKVLGASIASVLKLITKEYLLLIAFASVIAWPVSFYFLNNWLKNFSYRIAVSWDVFLFSGMIIIIIALVTVSYQSVKAARANPVEALKYE